MRIPGSSAVSSTAGSSPEFLCFSDGKANFGFSSSILIRCFLRQSIFFFLFLLLFYLEVALLQPRGFMFPLQNLLTAKLEGCGPTGKHSGITCRKDRLQSLLCFACHSLKPSSLEGELPNSCLPERAFGRRKVCLCCLLLLPISIS